MRSDILVAGLLGASLVYFRFYVYGGRGIDIKPESYRKPPPLESFALLGAKVPPGFILLPNPIRGRKNPTSVAPDTGLSEFSRGPFGRRESITGFHVAVYRGAMGEGVRLVTARYDPKRVPHAPAPTGTPPDGVHIADHYLTWIDSPSDDARRTFREALARQLPQARRAREAMEKVLVLSKAYLQLFMDLLIGAFCFIVVLFFVKYFLITRRVEGKV